MTFNGIIDFLVIVVGIVTISKYIVLWFIQGVIKFKFIKNNHNKIIVKEYIFYYDKE